MSTSQNIGTPGQSFLGYCGIAQEGSFGSGEAPEVFSDIVSDGFSGDNAVAYMNTIRSRGRYNARGGAYEDSGSIELLAAPENGMGHLLKGALGESSVTTQDPDSSGSPVIGEHKFTTSDYLPSLAVELGLGEVGTVRHTGCGIGTLELSHAAEEYLTASAEMTARQPEIQDSQASPTYSNLQSFMYHDGSFTVDGTDLSVDLQELTATIENNLEAMPRNERATSKMNIGERAPTVESTCDLSSMDQWKRFLGSSSATQPEKLLWEGSLKAEWISPETIGDTNTNYKLTIEMPRVVAESQESQLSENEQIAENVTFGALEGGSSGQSDVIATLINGKTNAY